MINYIKHLTILFPLTALILTIVCCSRHNAAWEKLDDAEEIMNSQPDSALTLLTAISTQNLKSAEEKARYALLMSMALDKNYIDTTTFDVLQPAIDYYLEKGTPDEKLRTYYYQGRIYQNKGDDECAMESFINGCELGNSVTDSLILAHTLVARSVLYYQQFKIHEYINNNIAAAQLYGGIGNELLEIKCYTNALDGYVMMNNKVKADSLLSICKQLVNKNSKGELYLLPSLLSYTIHLCSPEETRNALYKYENQSLSTDESLIFAKGYSKIGEYDKALTLLSGTTLSESVWDTFKYTIIKIEILEKQGKYEEALNFYKYYTVKSEEYQNNLLSQDLLFAEKKHQLELNRLIAIQEKDKIILVITSSIFALFLLLVWIYYRGYKNRTKRILAEKENENLRLEQDNLKKEKERVELERDKRILEAQSLENDKKRLEAEQRQHELETANLKFEIVQLEGERDNLLVLQRKLSELAKPIQKVIQKRLDLLNGLLAKEITKNDRYAEPYHKWIETIHNDKKEFMDSTRLAFTASHPELMKYLEQHGLSIDEINYLCLYAIGLRGKEVGEYIQLKRHYVISHEIRQKLGIDEHETNIGLYIRRLMKNFEK